MGAKFLRILVPATLLLSWPFLTIQASAQGTALQLYSGGNGPDGLQPNQSTNGVFYDRTFSFVYSSGSICLSSRSGSCAPAAIDDAVRIYVDGTPVFYQESYARDFGPIDFSAKLHPGANNLIRVQLIDLMGPSEGGSALWLVPNGDGTHEGSLARQCYPSPAAMDCETADALVDQFTGQYAVICSACAGFKAPPEGTVVTCPENGHIWLRSIAGFSVPVSQQVPENATIKVRGYTCRDGYTWESVQLDGYGGPIGWIPVSNADTVPPNQPAPMSPTATSEPAPQLPPNAPQPTATQLLIPTDVPISACFWRFIPGACAYAADTTALCHPQCVERANELRPDLPVWGQKWTPAEILLTARAVPTFPYSGRSMQVRVRDNAKENPNGGDLVVWPPSCGDVPSPGGGHIGIVTSGQPFRITDSNWDNQCGSRTNVEIPRLDCMSFITPPYLPQAPDYNYKLQPDLGPFSGSSPSGTATCHGLLDCLKQLFGGN